MSLKSWVYRNGRRLAIAINCLVGATMTYGAVTYFNSNPRPSDEARVGFIVVDLKQLDYQLSYEDLQASGLFTGTKCRRCDFSRGGKAPYLTDFDDPRFMGSIYKAGYLLNMAFYADDITTGQQHLEQSLAALRARFPGRGDAIRQISTQPGDYLEPAAASAGNSQ